MIRPRNLLNLDPQARKRGESTTGLSKRKRVIACLQFFLGVAESREPGLIFSCSCRWRNRACRKS